MQLLTKTGKPLINKQTKLPIHSNTIEARINKMYLSLFNMTKSQVDHLLKTSTSDNQKVREIKDVLFAVKLAGIQSSMNSLSF